LTFMLSYRLKMGYGLLERRKTTHFFPQAWLLTCSDPELPLAISLPSLLFLLGLSSAGVAQLVEHLICNQRVGGSIPSASSTRNFAGGVRRSESSKLKIRGWCLLTRVLFVFSVEAETLLWKLLSGHVVSVPGVSPGCAWCVPNDFAGYGFCVLDEFSGRVGEWLKPADCKSAAPCGLRRFESSPVHQPLVVRRKPQGNRLSVDPGLARITTGDVRERSVFWPPSEMVPPRKSAPREANC
jgi:hypothetical protein